MKRKKKLKLYVWEDVFSDYTSGIAFALATSPDAARKAIIKQRIGYFSYGPEHRTQRDYLTNSVKSELSGEPQVFARTVGFSISGGG